MSSGSLKLLTARRFAPLFLTQFLSVFNDNLFRTALVTFITYQMVVLSQDQRSWFVTVSLGLFVLPFFIFSATAGQLADKYCKAFLIRMVKFFEVLIMALAVVSFTLQNPYLLMFVLFLVGTQSAMMGPVKYSILSDHLKQDELIGGNGLLEASTFIAILIGTILGGVFYSIGGSAILIGVPLVLICAVCGFAISQFIPSTNPVNPEQRIEKDIMNVTYRVVNDVRQKPNLFRLVLGISWFWLLGSVILSQIANFTADVVHGTPAVFSYMLSIFSVALGIGSVLCPILCSGKVTAKYLPASCLLISIFLFDFAYVGSLFALLNTEVTLTRFLENPLAWRLSFDIIMLGAASGFYIVPLYTLLQIDSKDMKRSQVIAANSIVNALFMVSASIGVVILLQMKVSIPAIFSLVATLNLMVLLYICKLLPHTFIRSFLKTVLSSCCKVSIHGMNYFEQQAGKGTVVVVNHVSLWDIVFITLFLPDRFVVAMNPLQMEKWLLKYWFDLFNLTLLDPTDQLALKKLGEYLKSGQKVVIFPEGRPTTTGAVMKIDPEVAVLASKVDADILPVCLSGVEHSMMSQLRVQARRLYFPEISIDILQPRQLSFSKDLPSKARLAQADEQLYSLLTTMKLSANKHYRTLLDGLIKAKSKFPFSQPIINDATQKPLTYYQLILQIFVLSKTFRSYFSKDEKVGLMMPNLNTTVATFFALQARGSIPAMINFSHGIGQMISCCKTARVKRIITARAFIAKAKLQDIVAQLEEANYEVIYLEDIRDGISTFDKVSGLIGSFMPKWHYSWFDNNRDPDSIAVVLFTSGSEGAPKAVALSHRNIQANRDQLTSRIDFNAQDRIFNSLPMFHSFGLSTGTILPLLSGVPLFLYPSPKHYRQIPQYSYKFNATVMFGTDTFLANYAKYAHPYDFYRVRYVFAGAEKLRESTEQLWASKFGLRIYQGYGTTEASPALSNNSPMHFKSGSVGQLLPGIEYKLLPVDGIEEGGVLAVKGPNIMLGYLDAKTGQPTKGLDDGWYNTGDIVTIDDDGFIFIRGRAKRFAKIAGEMVSLMEVEVAIGELWSDNLHAVCVVDNDGSEMLHLVTDYPDADRTSLVKYFNERQLQAIMVPKKIHIVDEMPVLGSGKIDFKQASLLISSE